MHRLSNLSPGVASHFHNSLTDLKFPNTHSTEPLCIMQLTAEDNTLKIVHSLILMLGLGGSSLATVTLAVVCYIIIQSYPVLPCDLGEGKMHCMSGKIG